MIQLAAFRSAKKLRNCEFIVNKTWLSSRRYKVTNHAFDIGQWYVFSRNEPSNTRVDAEKACTNLRRAGQDCFCAKFPQEDSLIALLW